MEFYFSDANLRKDRFMTELVQENDEGYVDLEVFLTFHKIQSFTNDVKVIASALESSEFLQLSEDRSRVKRTTRLEYKPNVDECTLYVERLPMNADHAWLKTTFSKHGQVLYVSLPRYRHNNKMKGFAFVEFSTPEELEKACQHFGYQGTNKEVEGGGMADDEGTAPNIAMKHPRQAEENEAPSAKRQKLNEEEEDKSEVELKVAKMEEEVPESTEETEAESSATKRSKKRKRKKRLQKAKEQQPLLVMPKCEWKRLRNKYLALQKATMAQIKRSLLPCQPPVYSPGRSPGARSPAFLAAQSEGAAEPEVRNQKVAPATLEFQPNVIVKLSTEKPVSNATEFKNNIRHLANVAYVDVVEGECAAYVRCADAESARKFVDTEKESFCGSLSLLSGEEERMYWEKINQDRETRRSLKTRQKKRGVEKVIAKAQRFMEKKNQHIHFDDID